MVTTAKSPQANAGYSSGKPPQIQEPKAKITLHKKLRRHRPSV
ncbi:hypothetical protein HanIR_Chr15g0770321 [Helianthus annuus]|nr:hypothetical protein HanIR_Chr15g0770321 [Helianthus annuus]